MYRTTRAFVEALAQAGELKRVTTPVSPILDIAALADLASKSAAPHPPTHETARNDPDHAHLGGPALLFENVAGSDTPVLINALGSYRRIEIALRCHDTGGLQSIAARIAALVKPEPPRSPREAAAMARRFAPLLRVGPRRRRKGVCQQVVRQGDDIDLTTLPVIRCWPHDGDFAALGYPPGTNDNVPHIERGDDWNATSRGRYITLAGIHTIHADDAGDAKPASHNIGMYRVQLLGPRHAAMHWHMHHDGASHWRSWKRRGEPMPVAIALGGEAVLPYSATAPLPPGISELLLAGFLNGRGIDMVRAKTVPLWVPANADIVIEGYVSHQAGHPGYDPRRDGDLGHGAVFEGPFGDHTGFYSLPDRYPIVEVTAVTHQRNPIYPTTVVGLPPQEDYFMGKATERLFLPLLKTLIHDIEDYDLPMFGAFHNCVFVQIDKQYPLQARRVMHAIWGAGQMAWTKLIFVVDKDVDVHDADAVLEAAAANCHPARDLELVHGPLDILDHAAPHLGAGTKMGFDCTRKVTGEEVGGLPHDITVGACDPSVIDRVRSIDGVTEVSFAGGAGGDNAPCWLVIGTGIPERPESPDCGRRICEALRAIGASHDGHGHHPAALPPFVVVVGTDARVGDIGDLNRALFHWCANTDPGRDAIHLRDSIIFDATPKTGEHRALREWPPLIRTADETLDRIAPIRDELGF